MSLVPSSQPGLSLGEKLWQVNWLLVVLITVTAAIGFAMLYSAANGDIEPWAYRQMIRFAVGLVVMLVVAVSSISYQGWETNTSTRICPDCSNCNTSGK